MKTPAEFEPLGLWMGWTKIFSWSTDGDWLDDDNQYRGAVATKTSLTDAEACESLRLMKAKGWDPVLDGKNSEGWICEICHPLAEVWVQPTRAEAPTIHEAVEQALLKLIAAEGATQEERDAEFNRDMDEDLMQGGFN